MQTAKRFTNFSEELFIHKWNSEEWKFNPGETVLLQGYLAEHFAKHLVDREMQKEGKPINDFATRNLMMSKCLGGVEIKAESPEKLGAAMLNETKGVPAPEPKKTSQVPTKPLEEMNREELEEAARVVGITKPEEYKNKTDLKRAIESVPAINEPAGEVSEKNATEDDFEGLND
jgi:hypothetical protein